MADELQLHFDIPGPPRYVIDEWRRDPPRALREEGYELVDESFNSLTWERKYLDWPAKIMVYATLGLGLLLRPFMLSVFRLTARFDEQGTKTRVLLFGTVHPKTHAALREVVAEHGGPVAPPAPVTASTLLPGSPSSWPRTPPR